ncbi:MAG: DUF6174 domain-containing protein [Woeseiaceae bacterium]|nr:DUF6174 domain-containing protein [Woeseiaceae bacterium]
MQHRPWKKTGYQATTLIAVALLLLILFVSAGFLLVLEKPAASAGRGALEAEFERQAEFWAARRPRAFRYVVERSCFCAPDYRQPYVVREEGDVHSVAFASPLAPESREYRGTPPEPELIGNLFDLVRRALAEADAVDVSYDPAFGFPASITIDWSYDLADEEQYFSVRDFEVIEYAN